MSQEQETEFEARSWLWFVFFPFALAGILYVFAEAQNHAWLAWLVFPAAIALGVGLMLIRKWISGALIFLVGTSVFFQNHPYGAVIIATMGVVLVLASRDRKTE